MASFTQMSVRRKFTSQRNFLSIFRFMTSSSKKNKNNELNTGTGVMKQLVPSRKIFAGKSKFKSKGNNFFVRGSIDPFQLEMQKYANIQKENEDRLHERLNNKLPEERQPRLWLRGLPEHKKDQYKFERSVGYSKGYAHYHAPMVPLSAYGNGSHLDNNKKMQRFMNDPNVSNREKRNKKMMALNGATMKREARVTKKIEAYEQEQERQFEVQKMIALGKTEEQRLKLEKQRPKQCTWDSNHILLSSRRGYSTLSTLQPLPSIKSLYLNRRNYTNKVFPDILPEHIKSKKSHKDQFDLLSDKVRKGLGKIPSLLYSVSKMRKVRNLRLENPEFHTIRRLCKEHKMPPGDVYKIIENQDESVLITSKDEEEIRRHNHKVKEVVTALTIAKSNYHLNSNLQAFDEKVAKQQEKPREFQKKKVIFLD